MGRQPAAPSTPKPGSDYAGADGSDVTGAAKVELARGAGG